MAIENSTVRTGGSKAFYDFPVGLPSAQQANDIWGDGVTLPSNIKIAIDNRFDYYKGDGKGKYTGYIYRDQIFSVGNATSGYSKTPEVAPYLAEYKKRGFFGDGDGRLFGYATCNWIRACTGSEMIGSKCSAVHSGVEYHGYCFSSDTGSIECGHLTATDDQFGTKPVAFDAKATTWDPPNGRFDSYPGGNGDLNRLYIPGATAFDNKMPAGRPYWVSHGILPNLVNADLKVVASSPGAGPPHRCPTGSPAKTRGQFISKRLLIAGCMISNDPNYDYLADIHVPAYCSVPQDFRKGCMLPSARNFDPTAKQSGNCKFEVKGCTRPWAINYNSEASIQDTSVYGCIPKRLGCTVNSVSYGKKTRYYNGPKDDIPADQPGLRSGFFGSSYRFVGVVPETTYNGPAVLNYNSFANTIGTGDDACMVAVEGCMDSTAANYDPQATVNSWSWCIPKVPGCMMPTETNANTGYSSPSAVDGLNYNFSILTTVHVKETCVIARYGCNSEPRAMPGFAKPILALNHDPTVTVTTKCYWPISGCLNKKALNYGCTDPDATSPCYPSSDEVTIHVKETCKFSWNLLTSPPTPPPPQFPANLDIAAENVIVTYTSTISFTVDGDVSFWTPEVKEKAILTFRKELNLAPDLNVTLKVTAGSALLELIIQSTDESVVDSVQQTASAKFTNAASLQKTLGDAVGVKILSAPKIVKTVTIEVLPAPLSRGAVAGIAVGVAAFLFCTCFAIWKSQAKKTSQVLPFTGEKDRVYAV